ncbi:hypothetical protein ACFL0K_01765 [Patescibacteria group bacterium]
MKQNIKIQSYNNRIDAEAGKSLLRAHDIPSLITADDAGGMYPWIASATGGVGLLINIEDKEKALDLLKTLEK